MIPAVLPIKIDENPVATFYDRVATKGCNQNYAVATTENAENNPFYNTIKNKEWLTAKEACNLLVISRQALDKKISKGLFVTRWTKGNGGQQREILLKSILETLSTKEKVKFYEGTEVITNERSEANLKPLDCSEKNWSLACAKKNIIRLYLEITTSTNKNKKKVTAKHNFIDAFNAGSLPDLLELTGPISFGTVERWKKKLDDNNNDVACLIPNYKPRASSVNIEAANIVLQQVLSVNRPPINEAIRIAKGIMLQREIPDGLSDITYRRWIEDWKKNNFDLWTLCREGEKALNDKVMPYIMRDWSQIEVGDIIFADGHTLNFFITNPFTGKPKRMTLIGFRDALGMPLGFEIMPTENVQTIAAALRRTILILGFTPRVLYLDNGKAFRAKYFTKIPDFRTTQLEGAFSRLGIEVIFAEPYHGQSKTIEPFWGALGELERQMPTYCGTSIEMKPAHFMRNEKFHKRIYNKITDGTVTIHQAYQMILSWFQEYIEREHQDGFFKGRKPIDIYNESMERVKRQNDFESRRITRDELNYLMLKYDNRSTKVNGIEIAGNYYWNEILYGKRIKVLVKIDLFDDYEILVYDETGKDFICKATKCGYTHPAARILGTDEDVARLEEGLRKKCELRKITMNDAKEFYNQEYIEEKKNLIANTGGNIITLSDKIINQPKPIEKVKPEYDAEEISSMILNDEQEEEEYFDTECEAELAREKKLKSIRNKE